MRALVFDLDGTLVDSLPDLHAALACELSADGLPTPALAAVRGMVGDGIGALVARAWAAVGQPLAPAEHALRLERFSARYAAACSVQTRAYPGVAAALARLQGRGLRQAVCTNKPVAMAERVLADLDLARYFDALVGGDSLPQRKPAPEPLRLALARLGSEPAEALLVGDSPVDLEAGRAATLPVVLLRWGYSRVPVDSLGADGVYDGLSEFERALEQSPAPEL